MKVNDWKSTYMNEIVIYARLSYDNKICNMMNNNQMYVGNDFWSSLYLLVDYDIYSETINLALLSKETFPMNFTTLYILSDYDLYQQHEATSWSQIRNDLLIHIIDITY